jgi:prepilin-type N-terminal cleavage/methylation domain-containing protein
MIGVRERHVKKNISQDEQSGQFEFWTRKFREDSPKMVQGFTLIEILVALTIFSWVVTIATDIFLNSYRTQRKTEKLQEVSRVGGVIMEQIVKEIRENKIDYSYYVEHPEEGNRLAKTTLALKDWEGKPILFKKSLEDDLECPQGSSPCLKISNDGQHWSSLTPQGVRLKDLRFYLFPLKNPFQFNLDLLNYEAQEQPYVLILLSLEAVNTSAKERTSLTLQTSVSSMVYQR